MKNLDKIKQALLARKQELEEELALLNKDKITDDQVQDAGDQALSAVMETLRSSMQDHDIQEYKMITVALEKIDRGEYGSCEECGEPISERRLKVYPDATRCITCQEALEG